MASRDLGAARDPRDGYTADEMNAMVRGETTPAELCAATVPEHLREIAESIVDTGTIEGQLFLAVADEYERMRGALIECARISGADLSGGVPTSPSVDAWAVQEVTQLRKDYDEAIS